MKKRLNWTDEEIHQAVNDCDFRHYEDDTVEPLLCRVRDDLRARIGELEGSIGVYADRVFRLESAQGNPDHSIRVCDNAECEWIGYNCDTVCLGGIEPLLSLCPDCHSTTEALTPQWLQEIIDRQATPHEPNTLSITVKLPSTFEEAQKLAAMLRHADHAISTYARERMDKYDAANAELGNALDAFAQPPAYRQRITANYREGMSWNSARMWTQALIAPAHYAVRQLLEKFDNES